MEPLQFSEMAERQGLYMKIPVLTGFCVVRDIIAYPGERIAAGQRLPDRCAVEDEDMAGFGSSRYREWNR